MVYKKAQNMVIPISLLRFTFLPVDRFYIAYTGYTQETEKNKEKTGQEGEGVGGLNNTCKADKRIWLVDMQVRSLFCKTYFFYFFFIF